MKIKEKLQTTGRKVKETVVEYGPEIVNGALIVGIIGGTTYLLVRNVRAAKAAFKDQPDISEYTFYALSDEDVKEINTLLEERDEKKAAEEAAKEKES